MKILQGDKKILTELAKRYAELAALPQNGERRNRARDINDLKPRRPIVWAHEIPWFEMDIDGKLKLACEDETARGMEWFFRTSLFRWEYFFEDTILESEFKINKASTNSGIGVEVRENTIATDKQNHIVSHRYLDQLPDFESLETIKETIIKADRAEDERRAGFAKEMLGEILPVRLCGSYFYHAPWDQIPRHRSVEAVMIDLAERPELMHATIKKFTDNGLSMMRQMEAEGLLGNDHQDVHCTPAYASEIKKSDEPSRLKDIWFRGMAQMFGDVSPAMWEEFDLQYMKPLMAECALTYYGCCEALDKKIPALKKIPNLRKIGVSPWANPEDCAEMIGGGYVYAHKPNPAHVSGKFSAETVRSEITRVIEACLKNNCPYEFVLKDISTVTHKPGNLIEWTRTVRETIDKYYA